MFAASRFSRGVVSCVALGLPGHPPKGTVPRYRPRGVLRDCSRPVPGSCRGVVSPLTGGFPHRWPLRIVGGPPGPRGHAPSPCRGHGGVSGGPVWARGATQVVPGGGERRVWRHPAPLRGGCCARPAVGVIQGGRGTERRRWKRRGAPASVQGGGVAGVRQTGRAAGAPGMAPPPSGAVVTRAPLGESSRGGAERRRGRRRGAPASVQGPIKTGQAGPTGVGRGGRRLPAVTVPPLPPKLRVSAPPPLSPSRPRVPTMTRRPWRPRGLRVPRRWRR